MTLQGTERDDEWVVAEQALMDDMPCVPLYYPVQTYVVGPKVAGVVKTKSLRWVFKGASIVE